MLAAAVGCVLVAPGLAAVFVLVALDVLLIGVVLAPRDAAPPLGVVLAAPPLAVYN